MSSREHWDSIAQILRDRLAPNRRLLVVCSALSGISDLLEQLVDSVMDESATALRLKEFERRHRALAAELELALPAEVLTIFEELNSLCTGARLLQEAGPRFQARIMAMGELASTHLGASWLQESGLTVAWTDARSCLQVTPLPSAASADQRYLSRTANTGRSPALEAQLLSYNQQIVVTQGFIAANPEGHTVLLGRGGSDASAAAFASIVAALRLEIWTDVPGIFSMNPQQCPQARMIGQIGYDEALTMASLGAGVLHPRAIHPVREAGIPLMLGSTLGPGTQGTALCEDHLVAQGPKAVTYRKGLWMFNIERQATWQEVGQLANITAAFKAFQLSIDMISSSASSTRITVDPSATPLSDEVAAALCERLAPMGRVTVREGVGTVSVVGHQVLGEPACLASVLADTAEVEHFFVCPAADASHVTIACEASEVESLAIRLHSKLFGGPSSGGLHAPESSTSAPTPRSLQQASGDAA